MAQRTGIPDCKARGSSIDVPLLAALAAAPLFLIASLVPPQAFLPSVSLFAIAAAAVAATAGRLIGAERRVGRATIWDLAGAFALIGAAAGAMSDPQQVSHFFGVAMATP